MILRQIIWKAVDLEDVLFPCSLSTFVFLPCLEFPMNIYNIKKTKANQQQVVLFPLRYCRGSTYSAETDQATWITWLIICRIPLYLIQRRGGKEKDFNEGERRGWKRRINYLIQFDKKGGKIILISLPLPFHFLI